MPTTTLKSRATVFALCAGAVTFFLALLATTPAAMADGSFARVLIPALVCAVMAWAAAQSRIADTAAAIDDAVDRLAGAAAGDLTADVPDSTRDIVPRLAISMEALFVQLGATFDRVEHLALFDPVTGLANRTNFRAAAERTLATMAPDAPAALFFIDLDRFKTVNDTRGHACGDQLLAKVAERLRVVASTSCASATLVGRLAGDEFTILCVGMNDQAATQQVGDAILAAMSEPFALDGAAIGIGASIGLALRPDHGRSLHDLMRAADAAMYQSKADGRARMSRYSDRLAAEITDRERMDHELRVAIRRGEFVLAFQPQIALSNGELVASEALLRWRHPTDGLRPAADFLARAEMNGQMVAIGDWVMGSAATIAARWDREGRPGRLALNVGHQQVDDPGFFERLERALERAGAPASRIEIEVSEGVAMKCSPATVAALAKLRAKGAVIAIDDFGAGDSSVQRLRALPIDRIKLDRTLVRDVATDSGARTILQALVGLVHGLGCEAVAEGVEYDAQIDVLRVIGCDAIQGYAVARPMDDDALAEWIGVMPARARA